MRYLILIIGIPVFLCAWTIDSSWTKQFDSHGSSAVGIYNILGDSVPELLIPGSAHLYCFSATGESLWTFAPGATYFPTISSPVAADIDNDGGIEVVVNTADSAYALDTLGVPEWRVGLPSPGFVQDCNVSAALADINDDDRLEVFVCSVFGDTLYCLNPRNGNILWRFTPDPISYFMVTTPTVVDLDCDLDYEVLIGVAYTGGGGRLFCLDHNGTEIWSYATPGSGIGGWQCASACVGDIDGDDTLEVISTANYWGIFCLDCHGNEIWKNNGISGQSVSYPAMVDLDNDGALEVIVGFSDELFAFDAADGDTVWRFVLDAGYRIVSSPGIGDLDGNTFREVVIAEVKDGGSPYDSTRKLWVLDHNGNEIWSDTTGTTFSDATIGDVDHDGYMDILTGTVHQTHLLWVFETDTLLTHIGQIEWQTLQHDINRSGKYSFEDPIVGVTEKPKRHVKSHMTLFPNPAHGFMYFQLSNVRDGSAVIIFDVSGRKITQVTPGDDGRCRLETRHLPSGVYFAVRADDAMEKKKFVLIH